MSEPDEGGAHRLLRWSTRVGLQTPDLRDSMPAEIPGPKLGRYERVSTIGKGGGGEVAAVWDPGLRRVVAMKYQVSSGNADAAMLVREARIGAQLAHPNIVPVHEVGRDADGRIYFTMRRVDGVSLRDLIYGERPGADRLPAVRSEAAGVAPSTIRLLGIFLKLCEAVAYAHSRGVVHRDLKPHNVMVGQFGEVWLVDWGLCWLMDDPGRMWDAAAQGQGTPAWMAPESLRRDAPEPSVATDVYALGAILYTMLCGTPPWTGSISTLVVDKATKDPRWLARVDPTLPWELDAVVRRAMARDPAARYVSVAALVADVEAFLEGRALKAARYSALDLVRQFIRRHQGAVAVGAAAAVVVAAVGALALNRLARERSVASTHLASFRRVADVRLLDQAIEREGGLWPSHPDRVPQMEAWLGEAEALTARLADHRAALASLPEGRMAGLEPSEVQWLRRELEQLVSRLEEFGSAEGTVTRVRERMERARTLQERSLGTHRDAWDRAVQGVAVHPAYGGLALEPILGLVPLGPDPASGLWEFGDLESGDLASRGADGQLSRREGDGLVYVLVPGGAVRVRDGEDGEREVRLAPWLCSRFEMTQAQWERLMGDNPSHSRAGAAGIGGRNPVEYVSWDEAVEATRRVAATLPTEAQWEAAARAGTRTAWWTGDDPAQLVVAANLAGPAEGGGDPFAQHSPVGSFAPNPWGLADVHGNVYEWTLDSWGSGALQPGTGLREASPSDYRAIRGGGYTLDAAAARSDARIRTGRETRFRALGLRPARTLIGWTP